MQEIKNGIDRTHLKEIYNEIMRSDRFILIIKLKKRICAEVPVSPVSGGFSRTRFSLHNGLAQSFAKTAPLAAVLRDDRFR